MVLLSRVETDWVFGQMVYSKEYEWRIATRIRNKIVEAMREIELIAEKKPNVIQTRVLYAIADCLERTLKLLEADDLSKEFKEIRKAIKRLKEYGKVRK